MRQVWSCNEWDPLEEIIVGNPINANYPKADKSSHVVEFPHLKREDIPKVTFSQKILEETEQDILKFIEELEKLNIVVKRPEKWKHDTKITTPHWETEGFHNYCPRDIFLVIGDKIIESPNAMRSRILESFSYKKILLEYLEHNAKWFSAPRPTLLDDVYQIEKNKPKLLNNEPIFDAANILRLGKDLFYLISNTANELGAHWLQNMLGSNFKVHLVKDVYYHSHIDSTFVALRPGLLLCNPERVNDNNLPKILKQWEIIYSPPMVDKNFSGVEENVLLGSSWIGMNLLSLGPNLAVVDKHQKDLIALLEKYKIDIIPVELKHARVLGGGFHCITLDTRRKGTMENYFS